MLRTRSEVVLPARTAERAIGRALNRSIRPFCRSSEIPIGGVHRPESDGLDEDPRHHEVDVGEARACGSHRRTRNGTAART